MQEDKKVLHWPQQDTGTGGVCAPGSVLTWVTTLAECVQAANWFKDNPPSIIYHVWFYFQETNELANVILSKAWEKQFLKPAHSSMLWVSCERSKHLQQQSHRVVQIQLCINLHFRCWILKCIRNYSSYFLKFFFSPNAGSNFHLKTPLKEILISLQPFPQDEHTIGTNCFLSSGYFHLIPSLPIKIQSLLFYNTYYPHFGGSSFTQIANQRICLWKWGRYNINMQVLQPSLWSHPSQPEQRALKCNMPVISDGYQSIAISLPPNGMSPIFGPNNHFPLGRHDELFKNSN